VAIKGKGKTKSRPPARAPRRAPVEVPTPFSQRRWVQLVVALLVGAGIVWFVIWLTNGIRRNDADDREAASQVDRRRAAQPWKDLVETELPKVGSLGGAGAPPIVAAELAPAIDSLAGGDGDVAAIEGLDERLDEVADALEGYALADQVRGKGFDVGEVNALLDSRSELVTAMRTYAAATRLTLGAADLPERDRDAVLEEARSLSELAGATLGDAWNDYLFGMTAAGLAPTIPEPGLGGLGTGIPIGG
jgi:hypothetical protein